MYLPIMLSVFVGFTGDVKVASLVYKRILYEKETTIRIIPRLKD